MKDMSECLHKKLKQLRVQDDEQMLHTMNPRMLSKIRKKLTAHVAARKMTFIQRPKFVWIALKKAMKECFMNKWKLLQTRDERIHKSKKIKTRRVWE